MVDVFHTRLEREAESTDITLAAGKAAVDSAARITLLCADSEEHAAGLPSRRGKKLRSVSVRSTETPCSIRQALP